MSMIKKLSDKLDGFLRWMCGRLTPGKRLAVVLTMLLSFSILSVYMTVSSIYNMGRRDAGKEYMEIEHIRDLDLRRERKDSINLYKQFDYGTTGQKSGILPEGGKA